MALYDPTTIDPDYAIFQRAAHLLERDGWIRGTMFREIDGRDHRCLFGAMHFAAFEMGLAHGSAAKLRWGRKLGFAGDNEAINWNDRPDRTRREVVERLRAYAPVPA